MRSRCRKLRSLSDGISIVHVAKAALAASGNYDLLSGFRKVGDDLAGFDVFYDSADGNTDDEVLTALAVHLFAHALCTVLRNELVLESEVLKARQIRCGLQNNISAIAAVTTVGSAVGNVLLGMEAEAAVTAVSRFNINLRVIYKHLILLNTRAARSQ